MIVFPLLAFICAVTGDSSTSNWLEVALDDLKTVLESGDSSLGLPSVDPLYINRKFTWSNDTDEHFSFTGTVTGVSNYTVNYGDLDSNLDTTVSVDFYQINVAGEYDLNATYGEILPIQGSGAIIWSINSLNVSINATIKPQGGVIRLVDFSFTYDTDSSPMQLTGVLSQFDVGDALSDVLQDVVPNILQQYSNAIGEIASNVIETKGTTFLETLNLDRIIEIAKQVLG